MTLNISSIFKGNREGIDRRKLFTLGRINKDMIVVNEGVAITGSINVSAYGLGKSKHDMGFTTTFHLKNESGGTRTIDWEIKNMTQNVVLENAANQSITDGGIITLTRFWSLEKIDNGDSISFILSGNGIGTAAGSATLATMSFEVESIFLGEDETE